MSNQNEEIKLSNEYLNDKKQVLKLKEAKTKKCVWMTWKNTSEIILH